MKNESTRNTWGSEKRYPAEDLDAQIEHALRPDTIRRDLGSPEDWKPRTPVIESETGIAEGRPR